MTALRFIAAVVVLSCFLLVIAHTRPPLFLDLRVFYCGGKLLLAHHDPYDEVAIANCERAIDRERHRPLHPLGAPFPGYSLAAFTIFGALPFNRATQLYSVLLAIAGVACAWALAEMRGPPAWVALVAIAPSFFVDAFRIGQIAPFSIAALCVTAWLLHEKRPALAMVPLAIAAIEPHLALPAVLALAVSVRSARVPVAVLVVILLACSIAATGVNGLTEYVRSVLPAYAGTGLGSEQQYSFDALLFQLGVPKQNALLAGDCLYLILIIVGVLVAERYYQITGDAGWVVLIAPVFAIVGTTYLHVTQIAVVIPALLLLVPHFRRTRALAILALLLVQTPWIIADSAIDRPVFAIAAGVLYGALMNEERLARRISAGVVVAVAIYVAAAIVVRLYDVAHAHVPKTSVLDWWILKVPTIAGMLLAAWIVAVRAPSTLRRGPFQQARVPPYRR